MMSSLGRLQGWGSCSSVDMALARASPDSATQLQQAADKEKQKLLEQVSRAVPFLLDLSLEWLLQESSSLKISPLLRDAPGLNGWLLNRRPSRGVVKLLMHIAKYLDSD